MTHAGMAIEISHAGVIIMLPYHLNSCHHKHIKIIRNRLREVATLSGVSYKFLTVTLRRSASSYTYVVKEIETVLLTLFHFHEQRRIRKF